MEMPTGKERQIYKNEILAVRRLGELKRRYKMNYGREESEEFLKTKSCKTIYISHWASKGQLCLSTWVVIYLYTLSSCCSFS